MAALRSAVVAQNGMMPLHLAAENGKQECVQLLLVQGANVNIKNEVSDFICSTLSFSRFHTRTWGRGTH